MKRLEAKRCLVVVRSSKSFQSHVRAGKAVAGLGINKPRKGCLVTRTVRGLYNDNTDIHLCATVDDLQSRPVREQMEAEVCEVLFGSQGQQGFVVAVKEAIILSISASSALLWTIQSMQESRTGPSIVRVKVPTMRRMPLQAGGILFSHGR